MSAPAVRTAIIDRITAEFSGSEEVIDITNLHIDRAQKRDGWIAVAFPGGSEQQISLGSIGQRLFREEGIFDIFVLVETGKGGAAALALVETFRTIFRGVTFSGVRCGAADPPTEATKDKISPATIAGNWYILGTTIEYSFDIKA